MSYQPTRLHLELRWRVSEVPGSHDQMVPNRSGMQHAQEEAGFGAQTEWLLRIAYHRSHSMLSPRKTPTAMIATRAPSRPCE
jgi:hypothetical protein